jgi:hypothetical protein
MTATAQYSYIPGRENPKIWQVIAWYHYQWKKTIKKIRNIYSE